MRSACAQPITTKVHRDDNGSGTSRVFEDECGRTSTARALRWQEQVASARRPHTVCRHRWGDIDSGDTHEEVGRAGILPASRTFPVVCCDTYVSPPLKPGALKDLTQVVLETGCLTRVVDAIA